VTSEVEPVDEADQPALIIQRPGPELGQPLGGGGDEPSPGSVDWVLLRHTVTP
jgi:hypothetical protein